MTTREEIADALAAIERVILEHAHVFTPHVDEDGDTCSRFEGTPIADAMLTGMILLTDWRGMGTSDDQSDDEYGAIAVDKSLHLARSGVIGMLTMALDSERGISVS